MSHSEINASSLAGRQLVEQATANVSCSKTLFLVNSVSSSSHFLLRKCRRWCKSKSQQAAWNCLYRICRQLSCHFSPSGSSTLISTYLHHLTSSPNSSPAESTLPMVSREKIGHRLLHPWFIDHPEFKGLQSQIPPGDTTSSASCWKNQSVGEKS